MTDEEIEKCLMCMRGSGKDCKECHRPITAELDTVIGDALDYINRLKTEKAQVRKDTAKEILVKWWKENIATGNEYGNDYVDELVLDYGLDYDDFRTSIEVDDE